MQFTHSCTVDHFPLLTLFKRFLDQGHYYIIHMQIIVLKSVSHMYSYIKNWYMIRTGTYTLVSKWTFYLFFNPPPPSPYLCMLLYEWKLMRKYSIVIDNMHRKWQWMFYFCFINWNEKRILNWWSLFLSVQNFILSCSD